MKKLSVLILLFIILFIPKYASYTQEISSALPANSEIKTGSYPLVKDKRLIQALDSIKGTDGEWARRAISGYNHSGKPIEVIFKDLSSISPEFKDHDALGWRKDNGDLLIFVSHRHKDCPPEAIGSLLSHESIHQDKDNSIKEETFGWTFEAEVWMQLKEKYPDLKTIPPGKYSLVDRENLMEMFFRKGGFTSKIIEQKVRANHSYKSLPETSPGFGI